MAQNKKNARPVYDSHIPISDTHLKYCNKALFYTTKKGQKKITLIVTMHAPSKL